MKTPSIFTTWLTQPGGLAARLRAVRAQAGLSGKQLAAETGWQPSKVSRLENGKQMPTSADVEAWANACNATRQETESLLDLLGEVQSHHFPHRLGGVESAQVYHHQMEQESHLIRSFTTILVPGLLQIAEYVRRVLIEYIPLMSLDIDAIEHHNADMSAVDAAVAARMQRQQVLYDTRKQFEFLIGEPVLRWLLCPPIVMRWQLDRLLALFGMPNVRFGILPLGVELSRAPANPFDIYDDVAVVETFVGDTVHGPRESEAYGRRMDLMWDEALTGDDARELIMRAAEDLRRNA